MVSIDETHFPNQVFRNYVSEHFDSNKDSKLDQDEISKATEISIPGNDDLTSVEGIQYFTNLKSLDLHAITIIPESNNSDDTIESHGDKLTSIDLSKNTELEYLDLTNDGSLDDFSLLNHPKLKVVKLENVGNFKSIDPTKCPDLEVFRCPSTALSSVDVTKCPKLKEYNVSSTQVTDIDVTHNPNLEILNVGMVHNDNWEYVLDHLDVTKNPKLKQLEAPFSLISEIDISNNPDLEILYLYYSNLKNIDLTNQHKLVRIDLNHTKIDQINVSQIPTLFALNVEMTNVSKVDVTHNPELFEVYMTGDSKITEIDLTHNPELQHLRVSGTSIKSIDLSKNPKLAAFFNYSFSEENSMTWDWEEVKAAPIEHLDISNNPWLYEIYLGGSPITSIDTSHAKGLRHLQLEKTPVKAIDISKNRNLVSLNINDTKITSVDISKNPKLATLSFDNTIVKEFRNLDLTGITGNIYRLSCNNAGVESITFNPNSRIKEIECGNNKIAELNLENKQNPKTLPVFSGAEQQTEFFIDPGKIKDNKVYLKDLFSDPSRVTVDTSKSSYTYDDQEKSITFKSENNRTFDYAYDTKFIDDAYLTVRGTIKDSCQVTPEDQTVEAGDCNFTVKAAANEITRIYLGDDVLSANQYTLKEKDGVTTITIPASVIDSLKTGSHKLEVHLKNGRGYANITKKKASKPHQDNNRPVVPIDTSDHDVTQVIISKRPVLYYNGKVRTPEVIVLNGHNDVMEDYQYTLSGFSKSIGWHTVTATAASGYNGTATGEYVIYPASIKGFRLVPGKKSVDAIWTKSKAGLSGYQVAYSTKSSMRSAKVKTFKGETKHHKIIRLKAKKRYYVRVRSYKVVNHNGKKVRLYSKWTSVRKATTKR